MEILHKQSIICEDQINKFKNFKPVRRGVECASNLENLIIRTTLFRKIVEGCKVVEYVFPQVITA